MTIVQPRWVDEWRIAMDAAIYYTRISSPYTDERAICEVSYIDILEHEKYGLAELINGRCVRRKLVLDAFRFGAPE